MAGIPPFAGPIGTIGPRGQDVAPFMQQMEMYQRQQMAQQQAAQRANEFAMEVAMRRQAAAEQVRLNDETLRARREDSAIATKERETSRADQMDYRAEQARIREEELGLRKDAAAKADQYRTEDIAREESMRGELRAKSEAAEGEKKAGEAKKAGREQSAYAVEQAIAGYTGDTTALEGVNQLREHLRAEGQRLAQADPDFDMGAWAAAANERVSNFQQQAQKASATAVDDELKKLQIEQVKSNQLEQRIQGRVSQATRVIATRLRIVEENIGKNENMAAMLAGMPDSPEKQNRMNAITVALEKARQEQTNLMRQMGETELKIRREMGAKQQAADEPLRQREEAPAQLPPEALRPKAAEASKPDPAGEAYEEYQRLNAQLRGGVNAFASKVEYDKAVKRKSELERKIRSS